MKSNNKHDELTEMILAFVQRNIEVHGNDFQIDQGSFAEINKSDSYSNFLNLLNLSNEIHDKNDRCKQIRDKLSKQNQYNSINQEYKVEFGQKFKTSEQLAYFNSDPNQNLENKAIMKQLSKQQINSIMSLPDHKSESLIYKKWEKIKKQWAEDEVNAAQQADVLQGNDIGNVELNEENKNICLQKNVEIQNEDLNKIHKKNDFSDNKIDVDEKINQIKKIQFEFANSNPKNENNTYNDSKNKELDYQSSENNQFNNFKKEINAKNNQNNKPLNPSLNDQNELLFNLEELDQPSKLKRNSLDEVEMFLSNDDEMSEDLQDIITKSKQHQGVEVKRNSNIGGNSNKIDDEFKNKIDEKIKDKIDDKIKDKIDDKIKDKTDDKNKNSSAKPIIPNIAIKNPTTDTKDKTDNLKLPNPVSTNSEQSFSSNPDARFNSNVLSDNQTTEEERDRKSYQDYKNKQLIEQSKKMLEKKINEVKGKPKIKDQMNKGKIDNQKKEQKKEISKDIIKELINDQNEPKSKVVEDKNNENLNNVNLNLNNKFDNSQNSIDISRDGNQSSLDLKIDKQSKDLLSNSQSIELVDLNSPDSLIKEKEIQDNDKNSDQMDEIQVRRVFFKENNEVIDFKLEDEISTAKRDVSPRKVEGILKKK